MRNNDLGLSVLSSWEPTTTSDWESAEETFAWEEYSQGKIRWHYQKVRARRSCRIKPADATEIRGALRIPDVITRDDGMQINVVEISDFAFTDCTGLTSLFIPSSVVAIGLCAFSGCTGLMEFEVAKGNKRYIADNGVLYSKNKTRLIRYPTGRTPSPAERSRLGHSHSRIANIFPPYTSQQALRLSAGAPFTGAAR